MIIRNAARLVFAAGCLTAFATLSHAQPGYWPYGPPPSPYGYGPAPGAYGSAPGAYGSAPGAYGAAPGAYGPAPGAYGSAPGAYGPAPGAYGPPPGAYGPAQGTYAPQSQYVPPSAGTQLITNGPQTNSGDVSPSWSAQRNVVESQQYDRLLSGSPAFRQARMRKECGPITDRQLHQQCLDSFTRY
jgi:hypothetical protein